MGPRPSPCHTPVPVGIKKEQNPKNWGYLGLISWRYEGIKGSGSPGSLLRTTHWMVTPGLSPPLGPALSQQVSPGPGSWPLSTDLLSGQKEAATETLRQMERDAGIWGGGDTRERRHRKTETRWGWGKGRVSELLSVTLPGVATRVAGVCLGQGDLVTC